MAGNIISELESLDALTGGFHLLKIVDSSHDGSLAKSLNPSEKFKEYLYCAEKHDEFNPLDEAIKRQLDEFSNDRQYVNIIFTTDKKIIETIAHLGSPILSNKNVKLFFTKVPSKAFYRSVSLKLSEFSLVPSFFNGSILVEQNLTVYLLQERLSLTLGGKENLLSKDDLAYEFELRIKDLEKSIARLFFFRLTQFIRNPIKMLRYFSSIAGEFVKINRAKKKNSLKLVDFYRGSIPEFGKIYHQDPAPLVSVVMTAYNSELTIERAIESILKQSFLSLELIIVIDGATDSTLVRILKYRYLDNRVKVINLLKNQGTFYCKNVGMKAAKGKYITFQDADDESKPDRIKKQLDSLKSGRYIAVTCNYARIRKGIGVEEKHALISLFFERAPVIKSIGYFDPVRFAGDSEYYQRLKSRYGDSKINRIHEVYYLAYSQSNSLTESTSIGIEIGKNREPSPARQRYSEAFNEWHNSSAELTYSFNLNERPFKIEDKELYPCKTYFLPIRILITSSKEVDSDILTYFDHAFVGVDIEKISLATFFCQVDKNLSQISSDQKIELYAFREMSFTSESFLTWVFLDHTFFQNLYVQYFTSGSKIAHSFLAKRENPIGLKFSARYFELLQLKDEQNSPSTNCETLPFYKSLEKYQDITRIVTAVPNLENFIDQKVQFNQSVECSNTPNAMEMLSESAKNYTYLQLMHCGFNPFEFLDSKVSFEILANGWNCKNECTEAILSLFHQKISQFSLNVRVCDDASTDGTAELLNMMNEDLEFLFYQNQINKGAAYSRWKLIQSLENTDSVAVFVDLDDYILPNALCLIERAYLTNNRCLFTYGNWKSAHRENPSKNYSPEELDNIRSSIEFKCSPLRTFRIKLAKQLIESDFKDSNGKWFKTCTDVALFLPILDQCTHDQVTFIDTPIYFYNEKRPTGTLTKSSPEEKEFVFQSIRKKPAKSKFLA